MKLHKGDTVLVTGGKDQGRRGKIARVIPATNKVIIEGVNKYKKHLKPRGKDQPGSIIERERPLPTANVALICPKCKKQTRVGYEFEKSGKKSRVCRKCHAAIDSAKTGEKK